MMKALLSAVFVVGLMGFNSLSVASDDMGLVPRFSFGLVPYDFKQPKRTLPDAFEAAMGGPFPETHFNVVFTTFGVGGTYFFDRFYLDGYVQTSLEANDSTPADLKEKTLFYTSIVDGTQGYSEVFSGNRNDIQVTVGTRVTNNLSVYGGYKKGDSEADGTEGSKIDFTENGMFFGMTVGWIILNKGVFSVNGALANLTAKLITKAPAAFGGALDLNDESSSSSGMSWGFSWRSRLTDDIGYTLAYDINRYEYGGVTDANKEDIEDFEETFHNIRASASYSFQL
jgi:hypothetical protein